MGALAKRWTGARLIFDIRGFLAEEYVDAGTWPSGGHLFRLTKWAERGLLDAADGFVVLTERAREILFPGCSDRDGRGRPVEVIPCCVDMSRFTGDHAAGRARVRAELGLEGRRVIAYVGSLGGWYLTAETAAFLAEAYRNDPASFALVLTQSPARLIEEPLRELGVPDDAFCVRTVSPAEVPCFLHAADLAVSFIRPCYSKLSSSPTKIAEYLACGLPVVSSAGIGDVDDVIERDRVGVLVREYHPEAYRKALADVDELRSDARLAERCTASARARFDLERVGGMRYRRLYERVHQRSAVVQVATA
jgi:glycosyltransferase involved in cell wall biosynthesis